MKKLLIICLLMAGCYQSPLRGETDFEYVCREVNKEYDISCENLAEPTIVMDGFLPKMFNAWGVLQPGSTFIYVDPNGPWPNKTIIHEIVHYVLDQNKVKANVCQHEEIARRIADQPGAWRHIYGCEK